jgi:uncharacterized membrane protein YraQ (UPF0718 family)
MKKEKIGFFKMTIQLLFALIIVLGGASYSVKDTLLSKMAVLGTLLSVVIFVLVWYSTYNYIKKEIQKELEV